MFYKQLLIALTVLFSAVSPFYAQQMGTIKKSEIAKFTFSEEIKDYPDRIFKDANGGIYTITEKRGGKESLTKYDGTLKQVFEKEFILPKSDWKLEFMKMVLWNGKPTIFYQGKKKKQVKQIFYIKIEEDGTLGSLEQLGRFAETEAYISCNIAYSPDNSKLLVYTELSDEKNDVMLYKVYDKDLKELWRTTTETAIYDMRQKRNKSGRTVEAELTCVVDNEGRFLAYFPVLRADEKATKNEGDYFYQIQQFKQDMAKPKVYTVDYKGKVLYNFDLAPSKNPNEFIGYGTYTGSTKYNSFVYNSDGGVMGTYRFTFNMATNELKEEPVQPFPDAFFEFMKIKDKKKEAGNGIKDLTVKHAQVTDNNNLVMQLEENYFINHPPRRDIPNAISTTSYHSGLGVVVKYDANGKVLYQKYIPRRSDNTIMAHFIYLSKKEKEILIFNDDSNNRNKDPKNISDVVYNDWTDKSNTTYAIMPDNNGEYEISTLMQYSKENPFVLQTAGLMIKQYAPQSIIAILESSKKSLYKLVRIDY